MEDEDNEVLSDLVDSSGESLLSSSLSDEILLMIVSNLDLVDIINLSQTCLKFDNLLKDRTICGKLELPWNSKLERLTFVKFLRNSQRAAVITKLNLNDLYWVPSSVIRDIARPLINLQELHIAGTSLSWIHLCEILSPSQNIHSLSWSWDHRLETCSSISGSDIDSSKKSSGSGANNSTGIHRFNLLSPNYSLANMGDMSSIQKSMLRLKFLLLHMPTVSNFNAPTYPAHSGMSHFISKCENVEHLWILAWPKTNEETKLMEIFGEDNFPENLQLRQLKTFTVRVMSFPRLYAPKLINTVITSVGQSNGESPSQLEHLWLDHPLLSFRGTAECFLHPWPILNLNSVKRFSLPLMEGAAEWLANGNSFDKVKNLQITDGLARITNLNRVFDSAQDLETFVVKKAFNYKLDWYRFVETHPKLKEVGVCEDGYFPYPEICVALSTVKDLRKLSLPLYALLEILDAGLVDKHRATLIDIDDELLEEKDKSGNSSFNDSSLSASGFRSKRVSRVGLGTPSSASTKVSHLAVSGLDLLTQNCTKIDEFELGFSTQTRPGSIVLKSLSTLYKWKQLTKLTIEGAPVHDGKFLIQVAKSCKLQSLRLKELGSRAKCNYIEDLCVALQHMKYLEDFRLEQNYIGSTAKLFSSLFNCARLRRLLLWSKANDQPLDSPTCLTLMETCQNLMMLYLTVGATTKFMCESTRKKLESTYKRSRPGLTIIIRRGGLGIHEDALAPVIYPSVHYRDMVVFSPQIGQQNHFNVH